MDSEKAVEGKKRRKQRYLEKKIASAPIIKCACGCGAEFKSLDDSGRSRIFCPGHNGHAWKKWTDRNELKREWNHRNRQSRYDLRKRLFRRRKIELLELSGNKCLDCSTPYNGKNACIFHFHHRDPSKKSFAVGNQLTNKAWAQILKEVKKCDLICANCHEMRHSEAF
jgi:hypothetical protein